MNILILVYKKKSGGTAERNSNNNKNFNFVPILSHVAFYSNLLGCCISSIFIVVDRNLSRVTCKSCCTTIIVTKVWPLWRYNVGKCFVNAGQSRNGTHCLSFDDTRVNSLKGDTQRYVQDAIDDIRSSCSNKRQLIARAGSKLTVLYIRV